MITIFRRVREKLVASGSVTKYLLYAIGEILLVVIGILIALQVNNWNEERAIEIQRTDLLRQLGSEMNNVLSELDLQIDQSVRTVSYTKRLLNYSAGTEHVPADSLQYLLQSIMNQTAFKDFNITFEQAKSSGKFSLIKNDSLLLALSLLENSNEGYRAWVEYSTNSYSSLDNIELMIKADLLESVDDELTGSLSLSFSPDMHPDLDIESNGPAFIKDPETYKLMYQNQTFNTLQYLWLLNYQQSVNEVIKQIKKELRTTQ